MKIGIFGDSFADPGRIKHPANMTLSWPEIVAQKYDTDFHAIAGSSMLHSVKKFKDYHSRYDKILFVVTHYGRFEFNDYVKSHCDKKLEWEELKRVQGLVSVEHMLRRFDDSVDPVIKAAWTAALDYFKYINDEKNDIYFHNMMLEDVKRIRPDVILIPAFRTSFPSEKLVSSMFCIQNMENAHWGIRDQGVTYLNDVRCCHLTAENNEIFASNAFKWLNGQPMSINLADYKTPTEPMSKYFI